MTYRSSGSQPMPTKTPCAVPGCPNNAKRQHDGMCRVCAGVVTLRLDVTKEARSQLGALARESDRSINDLIVEAVREQWGVELR